YGYLVGILLVRSIARSERILAAMKCRGFNGKFYILTPFKCRQADLAFSVLALCCLGLIGGLEWL
ncbi:MAG: cobalt ECF transporter T component CbiQ, partial [Planctomycetes bacterium]|nr:cobalt ECF transporter T component CbiQ [Planctomycetota bacterium]